MSPSREARHLLRWSFADWSDLVLGIVLLMGLAYAVGFAAGLSWERDRPKPRPPTRIVVQTANALVQWNCTPPEHREYHEACKARDRLSRIKPKG